LQLGASHPERVGWGQQTKGGQHGRELQAQLRERERRVSEEAAESQDNPELLSSDEVRTGFVSGLTFGPRAVQYAVVDGRAIFEAVILPGSHPNFVHFQPGGGCSSAVGMRGRAAGDHAGHRL